MLYFSRWKIISILMVILAGFAYAAPNLLSRSTIDQFPDWLPKSQMTLGLDLQGGSHLLMQVDRQSMIVERSATLEDDARLILRAEKIGYRFSKPAGVNGIDIRLRDNGQLELAREKDVSWRRRRQVR